MSPEQYMRRCLELAQQAKGHTAPNPMVGAVLVHNERVIGEGWHHVYGGDHGEVNCLKNVADADKHLIPESTMYVSLEPCAHYGITPPCALRLVNERVKKVVICNTDPFEKVRGEGITILKNAGIEVETGLLEKEGLWVNRRFFCFHRQKRPYIILKWAQTMDGFIAPADKSRMQITGEESMHLVHKWRTEEAAIMVGATTARNDNPQLTARLYEGNQPLRITLDRRLELPKTHHLLDEAAPTWVVNEQRETLDGNIHEVLLPFDDMLLPALLHRLYEFKILSLIVEGGAHLLNCFINKGLWDEARIFTGPMQMTDGVKAPTLGHVAPAFETMTGKDRLTLLVNEQSDYQYVNGMEI